MHDEVRGVGCCSLSVDLEGLWSHSELVSPGERWAPYLKGHPEMRGAAILVLVGTRLHVIDAFVPEAEADANSQRFPSSLKITK